MAQTNAAVTSFNGGVLGGLLSARTDVDSYRNSAALMDNWFPNAQGPMSRRPGLRFVDEQVDANQRGTLFTFEFSVLDNYLIVGTQGEFRLFLNDGIVDAPAVSATITNGFFTDGLNGWVDASTAPAFAAEVNEAAILDAQAGGVAALEQSLTITQIGVEHVLKFECLRGELVLRVLDSGGEAIDEFVRLGTGVHQLGFTPTTNPTTIRFQSDEAGERIIDNVSILPPGPIVVPHPYSEVQLGEVHHAQKGDILYLTHPAFETQKLERRGGRSWSLVKLQPRDGPYLDPNTSSITLTPSGISGNITLTASDPLFDPGHVGTTFQLSATGQIVEASVVGDTPTFTEAIKITGVGDPSRRFTVSMFPQDPPVNGVRFDGRVTLQRSIGNINNFSNFRVDNFGPNQVDRIFDLVDSNNNQTVFYRLAVLAGDVDNADGAIDLKLEYTGGTSTGAVRIIEFISDTEVLAEVTDTLGSVEATDIWSEGAWSDVRGYPNAITFFRQRLFFGAGITIWASASDDFENFSPGVNDDESFVRTVATTTNGIQYLSATSALVIGTSGDEVTGRSNNFDDPVSPSNFQTLGATTEGGSPIQPVIGGGAMLYVQHARRNLMEFAFSLDVGPQGGFVSVDLNRLNPDIVESGILKIDIQREPERRIFVVLGSGDVAVLTYRREEQIAAWSTITTDGIIEDVKVLPDPEGDRPYFLVRRDFDGFTRRFIERLDREDSLAREERVRVDSGLCFELRRPPTTARPSGTTGSIEIETSDSAFVVGDVDQILWINGGNARITNFIGATKVEADVVLELESAGLAPPGQWGLNPETNVLVGLNHLDGRTVQVFADRSIFPDQVVTGGQITLPRPISVACVGLKYTSRWDSLKLAYGSQKGTALLQEKMLRALGLVFFDTLGPIFIGSEVDKLDSIIFRDVIDPLGFAPRPTNEEVYQSFEGIFDTDPRLIILVDTPTFATVNAAILHMEEHDRP